MGIPAIALPDDSDLLAPGMSFPGGLEAMMNFVNQQIGHAEAQLQSMADDKPSLATFSVNPSAPPPRMSRDIVMQPGMHIDNPTVHGNTQTGYRADLRFGADVRPVMNCHQCKTNKKINELVFCGHVSIDAKGYSTTCTKRYCRTCLWNWYMEQAPKNNPDTEPMWNIWRCPSCRKLCCCHRCRTFGKMQRGLDMTDLQEQAGALSPARCLARCLSEAPEHMRFAGDNPTVELHPDHQPVCAPCPPTTNAGKRKSKKKNPKQAWEPRSSSYTKPVGQRVSARIARRSQN